MLTEKSTAHPQSPYHAALPCIKARTHTHRVKDTEKHWRCWTLYSHHQWRVERSGSLWLAIIWVGSSKSFTRHAAPHTHSYTPAHTPGMVLLVQTDLASNWYSIFYHGAIWGAGFLSRAVLGGCNNVTRHNGWTLCAFCIFDIEIVMVMSSQRCKCWNSLAFVTVSFKRIADACNTRVTRQITHDLSIRVSEDISKKVNILKISIWTLLVFSLSPKQFHKKVV